VQRRQYSSTDAKDRLTGVMLFRYKTVAAYNWIEVTAVKQVITLFFFNQSFSKFKAQQGKLRCG